MWRCFVFDMCAMMCALLFWGGGSLCVSVCNLSYKRVCVVVFDLFVWRCTCCWCWWLCVCFCVYNVCSSCVCVRVCVCFIVFDVLCLYVLCVSHCVVLCVLCWCVCFVFASSMFRRAVCVSFKCRCVCCV